MEKKLLVVIDMQNDFIDGALGTKEAEEIVPIVRGKIKEWDGDIALTQDTHYDDYLETEEGKNLPIIHCLNRSYGHMIHKTIMDELKLKENKRFFEKTTFASKELVDYIIANNYTDVEFVGLVTDICVISNIFLCKGLAPDIKISVDADCCAGTTYRNHVSALEVMKSCQINVHHS